MRQKLEVLESLKDKSSSESALNEIENIDLDLLSVTQLTMMEGEEEYARDTFEVKRVIKLMQSTKGEPVQKVITLRSSLNIEQNSGAHIVAYEWIQTKGMRYSGYQSQTRL